METKNKKAAQPIWDRIEKKKKKESVEKKESLYHRILCWKEYRTKTATFRVEYINNTAKRPRTHVKQKQEDGISPG